MENKEEKKYEILIDKEHTINYYGRTLHRIRALKNFGDVEAGNIGGHVETEDNLSHDGNCWIYNEAMCMDNARVCDNAKMYNRSCMYNNSKMFGNSIMYDYSRMYDNAMMYDNSKMYSNSIMYDDSTMYGNSEMRDYSRMCDDSTVYGNAVLKNNDKLYGKINKPFKKIFQHQCERRLLTAILTEENEILYSVGCQVGITKEEFIDRICNDCREKGNGLIEYPYRQEYLDMIEIIENYFEKFKN